MPPPRACARSTCSNSPWRWTSHAIGPLDDFVCSDANLCLVAALEGLTVLNPEVP
jgi:hypothetical protein